MLTDPVLGRHGELFPSRFLLSNSFGHGVELTREGGQQPVDPFLM